MVPEVGTLVLARDGVEMVLVLVMESCFLILTVVVVGLVQLEL